MVLGRRVTTQQPLFTDGTEVNGSYLLLLLGEFIYWYDVANGIKLKPIGYFITG